MLAISMYFILHTRIQLREKWLLILGHRYGKICQLPKLASREENDIFVFNLLKNCVKSILNKNNFSVQFWSASTSPFIPSILKYPSPKRLILCLGIRLSTVLSLNSSINVYNCYLLQWPSSSCCAVWSLSVFWLTSAPFSSRNLTIL